MTYYLVLRLPFEVNLVHRKKFKHKKTAKKWSLANAPEFQFEIMGSTAIKKLKQIIWVPLK